MSSWPARSEYATKSSAMMTGISTLVVPVGAEGPQRGCDARHEQGRHQ